MTLLAARGLQIGRRAPLLQPFDLRLQAGECWFVIGRNGVGKSTLLQTLLGLLPPLAGTIERAPAVADRSGLGYVPQEQRFPATLPLQVGEFVRLGLLNLPPGDAGERTAAALQAMQIAGLRTANSSELSGGQRRRALIARALARRPALLVLDEAAAGLDPAAARQLGHDLSRLRGAGLCLLQVSHDLELVRQGATHVALLADGTAMVGPAAEVLADPRTALALGGPHG